MITLEEAKNLKPGDILISARDGKRWKVNGQVKTWKKNPLRIRVPLKHGLYSYDALTEGEFELARVHRGSGRVFKTDDPRAWICLLLTREA